MKNISVLIVLVFLFNNSFFAQDSLVKYEVKGQVLDASTNEPLIGAIILYSSGKGTQVDIDGNFSLKLENGNYELTISYLGYAPQKTKIKVNNKSLFVPLKLESIVLDEVEVVANVAQIRETPVAFSNISQQKIKEELGSRDIAMLMNSTPGAYATEQGGGSGDARVTDRKSVV